MENIWLSWCNTTFFVWFIVIIYGIMRYHWHMGMDQYLLIPFSGEWTSINPSYFDVNYRGTIGFDTLPYGDTVSTHLRVTIEPLIFLPDSRLAPSLGPHGHLPPLGRRLWIFCCPKETHGLNGIFLGFNGSLMGL
jgi:hypothetical protein